MTSSTDSSSDPAAIASAVARVGIRDSVNGLVIPGQATYSATTGTWQAYSTLCRPPDRVTVRYLAGVPLGSDGQMDRSWQVIVARLAAAEMGRAICACGPANRELYRWQFDVSQTSGSAGEQYTVSKDDLNNPLGTRRGHIYAWRQIKNLHVQRGFAF